MNLAYDFQTQTNIYNDKITEMKEFLRDTYWGNDVWDIDDSFFDEYRSTASNCFTARLIAFSEFSDIFKLEAKYYFARRISAGTLQVATVCRQYQFIIRRFLQFLGEFCSDSLSFSDETVRSAMPEWLEYLKQNGFSQSHDKFAVTKGICEFFTNFYDIREEFEKDVWDCRKISCINIPVNGTKYIMNFTNVPSVFRELVKRYIKLRVTTASVSYSNKELESIVKFLRFIADKEPNWTCLKSLTRSHVESFIVHYLGLYDIKTKRVCERLINIRNFLERIQQFGYTDAPATHVSTLLFYEDIPKPAELPPMEERIKYIPDDVMAQLMEHLEHLTPSEYIPVVIVLMASGWRASDVLALKYDNCLERTEQGWYLRGDIPKVRKIDHRIPITDEVKAFMESFAEIAKSKSTDENNPKRLLFNRYKGLRIGRSLYNKQVQAALNRLAEQYNITDSQGNVYYFKLHAFRHTKGVELINNGMSLIHVQKWMAHASPEMTLVYAKVLDTTLRKSWEQAVKNGIFRITPSGQIKKVDISSIDDEDLIEWEYIRHNLDAVRMPLGFCMKPKKQNCFTQLNPCLTCRNLCTTPDFLPQYEIEIQETKALIERGKAQGREIWVEKNQHLLERYEEVVAVLKTGHTRHIAGKKGREYIGEERNNAE